MQKKNPDYYRAIALPIAIDTVEVSSGFVERSSISLYSLRLLELYRLAWQLRSADMQFLSCVLSCYVTDDCRMQNKLNNYEYPTVTALESDLKRMVSNAKFYNDKSSLIFADAERIRKILSNNMPKINPAYKNPKYVAFPTPLPNKLPENPSHEGVDRRDHQDMEGETVLSAPRDSHSTPPAENNVQPESSFEGDSLQEAQDRIITELLHLKDSQ